MKTSQLAAICLILGVLLVISLPVQAVSPWVHVYKLPTYGNITDFAIHKNGSAWVVDNTNHAIYRIAGQITTFRQASSRWPVGITEGPDGNMWFTDEIANQIILLWTSGGTLAFSLGQTCSPKYIVTGADGNLWFTNYRCPMIGRITTSGNIQMFPADYGTELIRDESGNLWFEISTGTEAVKIGKYTIATGEYTAYAIPAEAAVNGISSLTYGVDGTIWFTGARQSISRITPTGEVTSFTTPVDAEVRGITRGPDGNMWFASEDSIYSVTADGVFATVTTLDAGTNPWFMRTAANGLVWFLEDGLKSAARMDLLNSSYHFIPWVNRMGLPTISPTVYRPTTTRTPTRIPPGLYTRTPTLTVTRTLTRTATRTVPAGGSQPPVIR